MSSESPDFYAHLEENTNQARTNLNCRADRIAVVNDWKNGTGELPFNVVKDFLGFQGIQDKLEREMEVYASNFEQKASDQKLAEESRNLEYGGWYYHLPNIIGQFEGQEVVIEWNQNVPYAPEPKDIVNLRGKIDGEENPEVTQRIFNSYREILEKKTHWNLQKKNLERFKKIS